MPNTKYSEDEITEIKNNIRKLNKLGTIFCSDAKKISDKLNQQLEVNLFMLEVLPTVPLDIHKMYQSKRHPIQTRIPNSIGELVVQYGYILDCRQNNKIINREGYLEYTEQLKKSLTDKPKQNKPQQTKKPSTNPNYIVYSAAWGAGGNIPSCAIL